MEGNIIRKKNENHCSIFCLNFVIWDHHMMISVIVIRPVLNSAVYSEEERGKSKQGEYCPVYSKSKAVLCVYLSDMLPL